MTAYYNEFDPKAAAWLRELIAQGHIAPGVVDERSIDDVLPADLDQFRQCHFFAGIGVWSYALRAAGWPDNRRVWTGSCPCQPFSAAGKGGGLDDERHKWPAWYGLIAFHRPDVVLGEQVSSKDGLAWFDLVRTDLEGTDYAVGVLDACAAGVGAPHIRQRQYFCAARNGHPGGVAHDAEPGRFSRWRSSSESDGRDASRIESGRLRDAERLADVESGGRGEFGFPAQSRSSGHADRDGVAVRLDDDDDARSQRHAGDGDNRQRWTPAVRSIAATELPLRMADGQNQRRFGRENDGHQRGRQLASGQGSAVNGLGHANFADAAQIGASDGEFSAQWSSVGGRTVEFAGLGTASGDGLRDDPERDRNSNAGNSDQIGYRETMARPGPVNGHWRNSDWLHCRDAKWRPVEAGTFPLAHGAPARVGRLRGYGNGLVAPQAIAFVESVMEVLS